MTKTYNLKPRTCLVGIDEVGRGPLAGPLLVAAVRFNIKNKKLKMKTERVLNGIRDSKKLSERTREKWFIVLKQARDEDLLDWRISFVTAPIIDREGISYAARVCVRRALENLACDPATTQVLLDGSLHAPEHFIYQKIIVRGDEKERLIAAASIVAKVCRDRRMRNYAKRFPEYGFEQHKGYGTTRHTKAIRRHGLCPLHRATFLTSL